MIVDDEFISNIPIGQQSPPSGEPWQYFMFVLLVTKHQTQRGIQERKVKYVHMLEAKSEDEITDALLDFVTSPNVECIGIKGQ